MRTTSVTTNVTQLTRLRFVNAYLVGEDDGFTLVDTTTAGAADALIAAGREAGGEIRRIVLTHGHGDHVGSLDGLKARLSDAVEVLMPELDARIHAGEQVTGGKPAGSWPKLATTPDRRLQAGDRVGSLEVVGSPGHSPGHVSFLDTRDGTLIAGDAFTSYGKVAIPVYYYPRFPFAAMATWDRKQAVDSARVLRDLDPAVLVVGHGPAVRDPGAAIETALARGGRLMPRVGLDRDAVVTAAAKLADTDGLDAVTLARLAAGLGVRAPSLYAHVASLDDLRRQIGVRGARELAAVLSAATAGRARGEAVRALADAYRAYARTHPGSYTALQRLADPADPDGATAAAGAVEVVVAVLRGYAIDGDDAIHAVRAIRAGLHGFVSLETDGGFGMPLSVDDSFTRLVDLLERGLAEAGRP